MMPLGVECIRCGSTLTATDFEFNKGTTCPKCGLFNSDEQRFCRECGQSLIVDCVLCHEKNKVGTRYCTRCGVNLKRNQLRRKKMMHERQQLRAERHCLFVEKMAQQQAEKLERLLTDLDEPENHEFAIYRLNQMGVGAVEALIDTMLNDADPDARYGSARAEGQICQHHEVKVLIKARSIKALIKALEDSEVPVRYWAADAPGKCGSRVAVEPLANLLKDQRGSGSGREQRFFKLVVKALRN